MVACAIFVCKVPLQNRSYVQKKHNPDRCPLNLRGKDYSSPLELELKLTGGFLVPPGKMELKNVTNQKSKAFTAFFS